MKRIVMLATRFDTMGGIASVLNVYREAGLMSRFPMIFIPTHMDGSGWQKMTIAMSALVRFLLELARLRVGLVHLHVSSRASFWRKLIFYALARGARVPTIVHLHGSEFAVFYESECGGIGRWLVRWMFDGADCVILLSETWRRWVASISTNPLLNVVFNPVHLQHREHPVRTSTDVVVVSFGRLGRRKGSYDLLRATQKLAQGGLDFTLLLAGDGEIEAVRSEAVALGIAERVHFAGWIRGAEKLDVLQRASIFALPSYHEGLPMAILEAMAEGVPIVASRVGGIPEAVRDGVEGILVDAGDVDALAAALASLLNDAGKRERFGAAARMRVETVFATDVILPRIEAIYAQFGFLPELKLSVGVDAKASR